MSAATAVLMLQRSGFTQEQVEALAEFNASQVDVSELVTKADLAALRTELTAKVDLLDQRMTIKLGTMIAAAVTLVTVAVKPL